MWVCPFNENDIVEYDGEKYRLYNKKVMAYETEFKAFSFRTNQTNEWGIREAHMSRIKLVKAYRKYINQPESLKVRYGKV